MSTDHLTTTRTGSTERMTITPGGGFNPANSNHVAAVIAKLAERDDGDGWTTQSYDAAARSITLIRHSAVTQVIRSTTRDEYDVSLLRGTKLADGQKTAAALESDPAHHGYTMTAFDPFAGTATLAKMTPDALRCREAVAVALSAKVWDVMVTLRRGGGFDIVLPRTYTPSKHDRKIDEVATDVIGRPGWYVTIDVRNLRASIIPAELPTFPAMIKYPMSELGKSSLMSTAFGVKLAPNGDAAPEVASINWVASAFGLLGGTPGSGKSVTLNALIAGHLGAGGELAICNEESKALDFLAFQEFVRPGGWGCNGRASTIATLGLIYDEGKKRAKFLEANGVVNWLDLPDSIRFKPILIIVDEVSGLMVADPIPKGVPKDHPLYLEAVEESVNAMTIASFITKIISQQRFVGMRMILSTQITNANTGIGPTMKGKLGHRLLAGSNPSKAQRAQTFNDETAVPHIPDNIKSDAKGSKGSGLSEMDGSAPFVFKSYFASIADYRAELVRLKTPTTNRPKPTAEEIARYVVSTDDVVGDVPASRMREEVGGYGHNEQHVERADGLSGAAAAGHDLKVAAAAVKKTDG